MSKPGSDVLDDQVLGDLVEAARPHPDEIAMDQARAQLEAELFGSSTQPARLGRFVLLERLGRGGMGSVYGAYDPELDRRVALKVLLPELVDTRARAQLRKEARSLARLSHPNVVPVHDVVEVEGRVVVVMEYVSGATVDEWQRAEPRSWSEILEVWAQIAEGVAAAHELGIIHRDVKPQNAIVGTDGRVRVVDFGLARFGRDIDAPTGPLPHALETATVSGAIAGTPAYMSPEQLAGGDVGPASDQFSFCVALYRALYDQRPFEGTTIEKLREAVATGDVRPPPRDRSVPKWVQAAVLRGLERDPDARHPSVAVLGALLRRDPSRRRRRFAAIAVMLALAGISAWSLFRVAGADSALEVCNAGPERLASVWSSTRRTELKDALAAAGPYGASIRDVVLADIDAYGRRFVTAYRSLCMAHQRGERSAELLDKSMDCLGRRLDALDAGVSTLLEINASSVDHAREVVTDLPPVTFCADTTTMAAALPPPEDPELRARVDELRRKLDAVSSLERLRRLAEALERTIPIVAEAKELGYQPVEAEAQLALGRIYLLEPSYERAAEALRSAERLALAHRLDALAVEAVARRLYAEAVSGVALDVIEPQVGLIEPISRRLQDRGFARVLLLNNVGVAYMAHNDSSTARRFFEQALAELESGGHPSSELQSVVKNLAMVTLDPETRRALAKRAFEHTARQLGENHTLTLEFAISYAHFVEDPAVSYPVLKQTCASYARYHPNQPTDRLRCLYYQGFLETELGHLEDAAVTLNSAAMLTPTPESAEWRDLARASALLLTTSPERAIGPFEGIIERLPAAPRPWWCNEYEAHARLGLGAAHLAAGDLRSAAPQLRTACELFAELLATNQDVENRQRLALARALLGRTLRARGNRAAAAALFNQAEAWYRGVGGQAYAHRLAAIRRWRK